MDKTELKEQCIQLYLEGKTYVEIEKLTGWSRTSIANLIQDDKRVIDKKNTKITKVYKRQDNKQMSIYIPTEYLEALGITSNNDIEEYVEINCNKNEKTLIIRKHS